MRKKQFHFYIHNNKHILKGQNLKIVLSKPSITAFDDYSKIEKNNKNNGIMYYYYIIAVYQKKHCYNDKTNTSKNKWFRVAQKWTHDFPTIQQLQFMINYLLESNPIENGQKHTYRSGKIEYSKTEHTEGFGCDDFYELTKYVDEKGNPSHYTFYVGCAIDSMCDVNSVGIRTPYLSHTDILELKNFVDSFINYSIDLYNNNIELMYEIAEKNKKIIENKLYYYDNNNFTKDIDGNLSLKKDIIESIFIVGDFIDIRYLLKENEENYKKTSDGKFKIISFDKTKNAIVVKKVLDYDRRTNEILVVNEEEQLILLKDIFFISNEVTLKARYYNIEEVTNDFFNILTEKELLDFSKMSNEDLFEKYESAIIDRTWLCWADTHNFPNLTNQKNPSNIDNAKEVVKVVIGNIKKLTQEKEGC